MPARKRPKFSPEPRKRYGVAFQAEGMTFQVVYFDTPEKAKAHAESFTAEEPRFEDGGVTKKLNGSAILAEGN